MFAPLLIQTIAQAIAQTKPTEIPPEAYRQVSSLTLMFALLCIIMLMVLAMIVVIRRNRRRANTLPKPAPTEHVDAWAESGKRFDSSITEIHPGED